MEGCGIAAGDAFLKAELRQIMNSPAWRTQRSLAIITFDEDAADGQRPAQRVPTLVVASQGVRRGYTDPARYTHYSLLRTVEAALGQGALTANDRYAAPFNNIFDKPETPDMERGRGSTPQPRSRHKLRNQETPARRKARPPESRLRQAPPQESRPRQARPRQARPRNPRLQRARRPEPHPPRPRGSWRRRPRPASRSPGSPTTARPRSARLTWPPARPAQPSRPAPAPRQSSPPRTAKRSTWRTACRTQSPRSTRAPATPAVPSGSAPLRGPWP